MATLGLITLTDAEHKYLADNIGKLFKNKDKLPEAVLASMGSSLDILHRDLNEDGLKEFKMRRHERRVVQALLAQGVKMLEKSIIPGYKQRMITPKTKKTYAPYLEKAKSRRVLLKGLLKKIEDGL